MTLKTWARAQREAELRDSLHILCMKHATPTITGPALYRLLKRGGIHTVKSLKETSLDEIADFRDVGPKKLEVIAKMREE